MSGNKLYKQKYRFAQVPNEIIRNPEISMGAKAMYAYLASRPDGWVFSKAEISTNFKEGRDKINSSLKELGEFGYLKKMQMRTDSSQFSSCHYELFWSPDENKPPVNGFSVNGETATNNTEYIYNILSSLNINNNTWQDFKDFRKKIKKPMTERAEKLLLNRLVKLKEEGHPPERVLEQSIMYGWSSVFPLKDKDEIEEVNKSINQMEEEDKEWSPF